MPSPLFHDPSPTVGSPARPDAAGLVANALVLVAVAVSWAFARQAEGPTPVSPSVS